MEAKKTSLEYRPDIDGLRAFAVLSVLIFHVSPKQLHGGFVGVDIFFVISGFLISSIIYKGLYNNSFSFLDFYKRRIRRIFPSLLFVLISVLIAGYFLLLPDEYKLLGWHTFGGSAYISNFILWFESGYFDVSSHYKVLLHLWSLGIEEQFYLIWPLLLFLTFKSKINPIIIISCLLTISFILMVVGIDNDATATFYSPQTRFWELLSGSLLAYILFRYKNYTQPVVYSDAFFSRLLFHGKKVPHITADILSVVGFIILICSVFIIRENHFPGAKTLFPIIGSIFIILAGQEAVINKKILSNKVMVWVGLISYPLYIWHWPLISFCWIVEVGKPVAIMRVICVILSFTLAWITYQFIEPRLRYGKHGGLKAICLLILVSSVGLSGIYIYKQDGLRQRFPAKTASEKKIDTLILEIAKKDKLAIKNCSEIFPEWKSMSDGNICKLEYPSGKNSIALIGDSHSSHTFPGMLSLGDKIGGVTLFPASGAAPYLELSSLTRGIGDKKFATIRKNAVKLIRKGYEYIASQDSIKYVILAHEPSCSYQDIIDVLNPDCTDRDVIMENGMRRTFDFLTKHNKKIFILLDNPGVPFNPKKCDRPLTFTKTSYCQFEKKNDSRRIAKEWYKKILDKVLKDYPDIVVIDSTDKFCDDKFCYISKNGRLLYFDDNHLTTYGSMQLAPAIEKALEENAL